MIGTSYLTESNPVYLATEPGQAHFAIGPHTCRECEHWANQSGERTREGNLKPARCRKALSLSMNRDAIPPIPHSATSCKHFAPAENPPEA